jgi:hypothetical protein
MSEMEKVTWIDKPTRNERDALKTKARKLRKAAAAIGVHSDEEIIKLCVRLYGRRIYVGLA